MNKLTKSQLQLILILLMVAIVAGAYRFGYVAYQDKTTTVQNENQQLKLRVAELEQKMENKAMYTEGIATSSERMKEILSKYGPGNTPEKSIVFVGDLEESADMTVSTIAFNPDTSIYASSELKEDGSSKITAYTTQLSLSYETTYDGLKKGMDFINLYPERMNVESFTAVYNQETGGLTGSMIMNLYSVNTSETKYIPPTVSGVEIGTDNIFGTYIAPANGE